jgi:alpha-mannosidase
MGGRDSMSTSSSSYPKLAERPVGKQIHNLYLDRLRQFTSGGQYESKGLLRYGCNAYSDSLHHSN